MTAILPLAAQRCFGVCNALRTSSPSSRRLLTAVNSRRVCDSQPDSCVNVVIEQTLVGKAVAPGITTLDSAAERNFPEQTRSRRRSALIKIDVEGAEVDVIEGASSWLRPKHYFVIEVHEELYLANLKKRFAEAGMILEQRNQQPLPFLGRERRVETNWWLVSRLD